jgi:hypothetical protein
MSHERFPEVIFERYFLEVVRRINDVVQTIKNGSAWPLHGHCTPSPIGSSNNCRCAAPTNSFGPTSFDTSVLLTFCTNCHPSHKDRASFRLHRLPALSAGQARHCRYPTFSIIPYELDRCRMCTGCLSKTNCKTLGVRLDSACDVIMSKMHCEGPHALAC